MELIPLKRILAFDPGVPSTEEICAPAIFPTSAWSIEAVGEGGSSSELTDSTEKFLKGLNILV